MPMTAQNWELQNDEKDLGSADVRLASASRYFFLNKEMVLKTMLERCLVVVFSV